MSQSRGWKCPSTDCTRLERTHQRLSYYFDYIFVELSLAANRHWRWDRKGSASPSVYHKIHPCVTIGISGRIEVMHSLKLSGGVRPVLSLKFGMEVWQWCYKTLSQVRSSSTTPSCQGSIYCSNIWKEMRSSSENHLLRLWSVTWCRNKFMPFPSLVIFKCLSGQSMIVYLINFHELSRGMLWPPWPEC